MSFEEGAPITEVDTMQQSGLRAADVNALLCEAFNAMIFEGGFVHCDPHPGNCFVRPHPTRPSQPQLVLLDRAPTRGSNPCTNTCTCSVDCAPPSPTPTRAHPAPQRTAPSSPRGGQAGDRAPSSLATPDGLYRDLPRSFVTLYAHLWHAMLLGDADGIRAVGYELGVGDYYPLLAAMLSGRPWADILAAERGTARLREKGTAEDKEQIRGYAQQYIKHIAIVLEKVPPPMLLLFKCNDCLRHTERRLDSGINSFVISMRYCLQTLLVDMSDLGVAGAAVARPSGEGQAPGSELARRGSREPWTALVHATLRRMQMRLILWVIRASARSLLLSSMLPSLARLLSPRTLPA